MEYLFVALITVLISLIIILIYFSVNYFKERSQPDTVRVATSYPSDGTSPVTETNRFGTYSPLKKNVKVFVFLEECFTHNQFRAEIADDNVVIGRVVEGLPECSKLAVSSSQYLSRSHCSLSESNGNVYITNLSRYGTLLNHAAVNCPTRLDIGDDIIMGNVELKVLSLVFLNNSYR